MASQGPRYPGTVTTNSAAPESNNDWLTPSNIGADDGAEAQITAATYDSPDISFQLIAANFGFTIPTGSTINGITVEVDRRCFAGSASDNRIQLRDGSGTLVGTNKAATTTAWPGTLGIATYGATNDTWSASPTVAMVNDPDFGVVLSVQADSANTDVGVDFIRVTIEYTPPADDRARVSWAELEVPTAPRRSRVSFAELEIPTAPRRARVAFAEIEVPNGPRRGRVSFAEFEIPDLSNDRQARIAWTEFEIPNAPRRALVSFAELETPTAPRRALVSWTEFEVPEYNRRAYVSFVELEIPNAPRRARVSWAEIEVPEVGAPEYNAEIWLTISRRRIR